jgi:hypothetical protein
MLCRLDVSLCNAVHISLFFAACSMAGVTCVAVLSHTCSLSAFVCF